MFPRFAERRVREVLADTPVALIVGPRRAGKTTLVRRMAEEGRTCITLDDRTTLNTAQSDPNGFIRGLDRVIIDEIQRAPNLLPAIKMSVDADCRPGRFLLTSSTNVMTLAGAADVLEGRIETICMLPLSQAEMFGFEPTFLERLFAGRLEGTRQAILGDDLARLMLVGGFPEANLPESESRRRVWARSYLTSVLAHELSGIAGIKKLADLPAFIRMLAEYSGQLVNFSRFGSSIGVSYKTGQRYAALLEQVFLVSAVPPWHTDALKRIARTPKLHFLDPGLLAAARKLRFDRVRANRSEFGALMENFVISEVLKLMTASDMDLTAHHFQERQMRKVDIVLERDDGKVAGIEVKAAATVAPRDVSGLRTLAEACGERFAGGAVLYDSDRFVPLGDKLAAVPLSCLWE